MFLKALPDGYGSEPGEFNDNQNDPSTPDLPYETHPTTRDDLVSRQSVCVSLPYARGCPAIHQYNAVQYTTPRKAPVPEIPDYGGQSSISTEGQINLNEELHTLIKEMRDQVSKMADRSWKTEDRLRENEVRYTHLKTNYGVQPLYKRYIPTPFSIPTPESQIIISDPLVLGAIPYSELNTQGNLP